MPYIYPPSPEQPARVPGYDADMWRYIGILREMFERFYPKVPWYAVDYTPTVADAPPDSEASLSGVLPGTVIDVLRDEPVPVNDRGEFVQPHTTTTIDPGRAIAFKPPVHLHAYFNLEDADNPMSSFGTESSHTVEVTLLTAVCDEAGLTVGAGDEFDYANQRWSVLDAYTPTRGYWKLTRIPLFVTCRCRTVRRGS